MRELFAEAIGNQNISENPKRKATLPNCKKAKETESLTAEQVCRLFERSAGHDYMMCRVLVPCGLTIGEYIALKKTDVMAFFACCRFLVALPVLTGAIACPERVLSK